jgi:hypothetical protein
VAPRRDLLPGDVQGQGVPPHRAPARRAGGSASVLAVQRMAGNRAMGQLLRKKKEEPPPLDRRQSDLSFALKYVQDYYDGVEHVLDLKDKVQQQAIENFKEFGKLKDPPSIADAVLAEIFSQAIGLIPGGKLVTATLTAGVFAVQLAEMQRELNTYPIPGMSVEDEAKKGPSEKTKAKVEKVVGHGKTAVDAGKAVVGAGIKAAQERAAATAAEAAAKENALMQSSRISSWRSAIELAQSQEQAIVAELERAVTEGKDLGQLKAYVVKKLGPLPVASAELQNKLERQYELELYRQKLRRVTITTKYYGGGVRMRDSSEQQLELVDGGEPSGATRRRIATLLGHPHLWEYPLVLAQLLGVADASRQRYSKPPGMELEPSRPGMGG